MGEYEEYVKRYAEGREITVEEALTHSIVKDAKEYYKHKPQFEAQIACEANELCTCDS